MTTEAITMETEVVAIPIGTLRKVNPDMLPGIPELVDVIVSDNLECEEDPEVYAAVRCYTSKVMLDLNSLGDDQPLPLSYYDKYVLAFIDGYQAAREKYQSQG